MSIIKELTPGTISFPIFTTVCMQLMNSSIALPDMRTEYQIHGGGSGGSTTLSTSSSSETFIRSPRPYPQGSAYKEGHVIGNGAYGTVYKAHEIHDPDKIVALKKVRIPITEDGVPVSILREISLVRQLDHFEHPNIVRFLDVCTGPRIGAEHLLYLVFEYVDKDLAKFIQTASIEELSISKIQNITYQILTGIDFLHSQRIIHRDLKPHNLLISKAGIIKIADFGLAKIYDFTMRLTSVVVTLWYRSPEILLACSYGSPVDIWSIGCIFAELYRRRALFPGENERDQLNKIFDIIGTPSDQEWPNETPLLPSNFPYRPSKLLESQVPGLCSESLDLLKKLLLFNPKSRLDARTALKHPFFQSVISKTTLSVS